MMSGDGTAAIPRPITAEYCRGPERPPQPAPSLSPAASFVIACSRCSAHQTRKASSVSRRSAPAGPSATSPEPAAAGAPVR